MTGPGLTGCLDALTSAGFAEGWAYDAGAIGRVVAVSIRRDGAEVAGGLANLWRRDLMEAGCGTGWCAFRLRLLPTPAPGGDTAGGTFRLEEAGSGRTIAATARPHRLQDHDAPVTSVGALIGRDPTCVADIGQLAGCGALLQAYADALGIEQFVRTAYLYVLHRSADGLGLARYVEMLRTGTLTPYGIIAGLAGSQEFQGGNHNLSAPSAPGFPFLPA